MSVDANSVENLQRGAGRAIGAVPMNDWRPIIASAPVDEAPGDVLVGREPFGHMTDGRAVELLTLTNSHGIELRVMTYGGIILSLRVPDRDGQLDDVVLGHETVAGYMDNDAYFGAIIGRYANRIADGRFTLDGTAHTLATNDGAHHLHGGARGFDQALWTANVERRSDGSARVVLRHVSPHGDEGYPGALRIRLCYTLTPCDEIVVDYRATTDRATPVNLTQHSYFNLAGAGSRDVLDHTLTIHAAHFTPVDAGLIPTGERRPVADTPFDFRQPTPIGARIDADDAQLRVAGGYDHNFVLTRSGSGLVLAARLADPVSGRILDVHTTEPGLQFYSGNFLDGTVRGKGGVIYEHRSAVCLEPQHFPDSPNQPAFPSTVLIPGAEYRSRTVFAFTTRHVDAH